MNGLLAADGTAWVGEALPMEGHKRLCEIGFSDIFLSTSPQAPLLALNVSGLELLERALSRAPRRLPEAYREDSLRLLTAVEAKWVAEQLRPEFSMVYDGVNYRCAQIVAPDDVLAAGQEGSTPKENRNWCLRRIDTTHLKVGSLGMPKWCGDEIVRVGGSPGLFLVAGGFSSGKSTTSAACLREWVDTHGGVGVTIEDPPEKVLQGYYTGGQIYQLGVRHNAFAETIRMSRRWAYRYLFLGEVRDQEIAEEALQVALGGPLVLTTIHASGAVEALMALSRFAAGQSDPDSVNDRIAASIVGVLWQSLSNGRLEIQYLSFRGRNAPAMRTKISDGRFRLLREDLAYQTNLRNLGRVADSF